MFRSLGFRFYLVRVVREVFKISMSVCGCGVSDRDLE